MRDTSKSYRAYLLRMWRAGGEDGGPWRASTEDGQTGERMMFGDLDDLFAFLRQETSGQASDEQASEPARG